VLPGARYVFLLRNPLAILHSQLERWARPTSFQHLTSLRNETVLAPPRILAGIDLLGDDAIVVRYEELVTEPERVVAGLCARLDLDFQPHMLEYGERPDPPGRGRFFDGRGIPQHRRPVTASLDKWRTLGDDPQRRHIARSFLFELGPEVVGRLGYPFDELASVVAWREDEDEGVVCSWDAVMAPAAAADAALDAYPGTADYPPSPPDRRHKPETPSRLSVIVPTHGTADLLERALRSVLTQGRPNVEVIVVPDASHPGTDSVVDRFRPWVATVTEPVVGGFASAVQRGVEASTGEVLTWLHPGEVHLGWTLATAGKVFSELVDVECLLGSAHLVLDDTGRPVDEVTGPPSLRAWLGPDVAQVTPLRFPFVRRTLWTRAGGYVDPLLLDAPECELLPRLASHSRPAVVPVALGGAFASPWWVAARYADAAAEYRTEVDAAVPSVDPHSDVPFARLHYDGESQRWLRGRAGAGRGQGDVAR